MDQMKEDMQINWLPNLPRLQDEEAIDELRRQVKLPEEERPSLWVHSWKRSEPFLIAGYYVYVCIVDEVSSIPKKYTFGLDQLVDWSSRVKKGVLVVWPTEFADEEKGLYPLLGIQILA